MSRQERKFSNILKRKEMKSRRKSWDISDAKTFESEALFEETNFSELKHLKKQHITSNFDSDNDDDIETPNMQSEKMVKVEGIIRPRRKVSRFEKRQKHTADLHSLIENESEGSGNFEVNFQKVDMNRKYEWRRANSACTHRSRSNSRSRAVQYFSSDHLHELLENFPDLKPRDKTEHANSNTSASTTEMDKNSYSESSLENGCPIFNLNESEMMPEVTERNADFQEYSNEDYQCPSSRDSETNTRVCLSSNHINELDVNNCCEISNQEKHRHIGQDSTSKSGDNTLIQKQSLKSNIGPSSNIDENQDIVQKGRSATLEDVHEKWFQKRARSNSENMASEIAAYHVSDSQFNQRKKLPVSIPLKKKVKKFEKLFNFNKQLESTDSHAIIDIEKQTRQAETNSDNYKSEIKMAENETFYGTKKIDIKKQYEMETADVKQIASLKYNIETGKLEDHLCTFLNDLEKTMITKEACLPASLGVEEIEKQISYNTATTILIDKTEDMISSSNDEKSIFKSHCVEEKDNEPPCCEERQKDDSISATKKPIKAKAVMEEDIVPIHIDKTGWSPEVNDKFFATGACDNGDRGTIFMKSKAENEQDSDVACTCERIRRYLAQETPTMPRKCVYHGNQADTCYYEEVKTQTYITGQQDSWEDSNSRYLVSCMQMEERFVKDTIDLHELKTKHTDQTVHLVQINHFGMQTAFSGKESLNECYKTRTTGFERNLTKNEKKSSVSVACTQDDRETEQAMVCGVNDLSFNAEIQKAAGISQQDGNNLNVNEIKVQLATGDKALEKPRFSESKQTSKNEKIDVNHEIHVERISRILTTTNANREKTKIIKKQSWNNGRCDSASLHKDRSRYDGMDALERHVIEMDQYLANIGSIVESSAKLREQNNAMIGTWDNLEETIGQNKKIPIDKNFSHTDKLKDIRREIKQLLDGKSLKNQQKYCLLLILTAIEAEMPITFFERLQKSKSMRAILGKLVNDGNELLMYNTYSAEQKDS